MSKLMYIPSRDLLFSSKHIRQKSNHNKCVSKTVKRDVHFVGQCKVRFKTPALESVDLQICGICLTTYNTGK